VAGKAVDQHAPLTGAVSDRTRGFFRMQIECLPRSLMAPIYPNLKIGDTRLEFSCFMLRRCALSGVYLVRAHHKQACTFST